MAVSLEFMSSSPFFCVLRTNVETCLEGTGAKAAELLQHAAHAAFHGPGSIQTGEMKIPSIAERPQAGGPADACPNRSFIYAHHANCKCAVWHLMWKLPRT